MKLAMDNPSTIFGTATRTKTLLTIYMLEETYPSQVALVLDVRVYLVQRAVESLEADGLIVTRLEGNQRRLSMNPRSKYRKELEALLQKMAIRSVDLQERLGQIRRRPRKIGKEI